MKTQCTALLFALSLSGSALAQENNAAPANAAWGCGIFSGRPYALGATCDVLTSAYYFLGADANSIDVTKLTTADFESKKERAIVSEEDLRAVLARCVVGTNGIYGEHITAEQQASILSFVFSKPGLYSALTSEAELYLMKDVPGDVIGVDPEEKNCALGIRTKALGRFDRTFDAVIQGTMMD